jgi:hypothetical protein
MLRMSGSMVSLPFTRTRCGYAAKAQSILNENKIIRINVERMVSSANDGKGYYLLIALDLILSNA